MIEKKRQVADDDGRPSEINDPDAQNSEQNESGTQAQDVAGDALGETSDPYEESEHGGRKNPAQIVPDDALDLIDKMKEMRNSGRIDMDAYEGEDDMDDEAED